MGGDDMALSTEALKRALSEVKIEADSDLADAIEEARAEKARVRSEIAKLQAEHAKLKQKLKQEEILRNAMMQSPARPAPGRQVGTTFGVLECAWCGKSLSVFAITSHVIDSDGHPFCGDVCMVAQVAFDHQELQAGLDYVKRSLGIEEEIA